MLHALAVPFRALFVVCAIGAAFAHADLAPHPSNRFEFVWQTTPVAVIETTLLDCGDNTCANPVPTRFNSDAQFLKLIVTFEDRVRTSGVFEKHGFATVFQVRVNPDHLEVAIIEQTLPWKLALMTANFCNAVLITLAIEFPIAVLLLRRWRIQYRKRWIVIANLMTLPALWVLTSIWMAIGDSAVWILETFVAAAETIYYRIRMRGAGLTWSRAFAMSVSANVASVAIPFVWALVPLLWEYA